VGYELWSTTPPPTPISVTQARRAIPRAIATANRLVHEPVLRDLSPKDRAFLQAMTQDDHDPTRLADLTERLHTTRGTINTYRSRLIAAEVIEPAGRGLVRFTIPFLRQYLRKTPPAL
jgi:hypothetical protein